ncbi:hypothetical protein CERSUDRAFT_161408 [Gelatoporia subvermispora B]|uniref:Protein kinase domain-containing protein n=1 Tax=Ceriporiopsis subvermispora (strain B) TaxID=914234 RepID=M2PAI2_CERS8|nr:hypothetical protein CERSUDRAFT_161408 [Gelatoporia subvermispora B]
MREADATFQHVATFIDTIQYGLNLVCLNCVVSLLDKILAFIEDGNPSRPQLCDILCKICQRTDLLPSSCIVSLDLCDIASSKVVGQGGFGAVRLGNFEGDNVAVKHLVRNKSTEITWHKYIYRELFILRYSRHPNVVSFRGVHIHASDVYIVYDWIAQGNINDYLKKHEAANRVKLLRDVAAGMRYLHEHDVVHGDLKGANILIDDKGNARIADFGLATFHYDGKVETNTRLLGTTQWMAPELLIPEKFAARNVRTRCSDVYAFAMTAIEVFSLDTPFADAETLGTVIWRVCHGGRPSRPNIDPEIGLSDTIWELIERCWHHDFRQRPAFDEIWLCLESELAKFPNTGSV